MKGIIMHHPTAVNILDTREVRNKAIVLVSDQAILIKENM